jgi:dipeptidyl aminopeptidase/acylaminoacyl peptidase
MLIEKGIVDSDRMAIVGASYGGYMTSWTISQTNRFKAAVAGAAITDVPSFMRTTDVPDRFEDYLGNDPRLWNRHSPMHYASNIVTPTLIWHGDGDIRVPMMQGRHLYTALLANGTPTEFVIYQGEAHGVSNHEHARDLMERKIRWLDRWVLDKEGTE